MWETLSMLLLVLILLRLIPFSFAASPFSSIGPLKASSAVSTPLTDRKANSAPSIGKTNGKTLRSPDLSNALICPPCPTKKDEQTTSLT